MAVALSGLACVPRAVCLSGVGRRELFSLSARQDGLVAADVSMTPG